MKFGKTRRFRFTRGKILGTLAVLALLFFFLIQPIFQIRKKGQVVVASAKELKAAFAQNDIDLVDTKLKDTEVKYEDFRKSSHRLYWLAFIPYVSDFKNGVEGGHFAMLAGDEAVQAIKPYADLIGFKKGASSFVEQSLEDRL